MSNLKSGVYAYNILHPIFSVTYDGRLGGIRFVCQGGHPSQHMDWGEKVDCRANGEIVLKAIRVLDLGFSAMSSSKV